MTDLEMTKACAEAMGYTEFRYYGDCDPGYECASVKERPDKWWPLRDDAQAMALVKKFGLDIRAPVENAGWEVWFANQAEHHHTEDANLNRAICECVAKMKIV